MAGGPSRTSLVVRQAAASLSERASPSCSITPLLEKHRLVESRCFWAWCLTDIASFALHHDIGVDKSFPFYRERERERTEAQKSCLTRVPEPGSGGGGIEPHASVFQSLSL